MASKLATIRQFTTITRLYLNDIKQLINLAWHIEHECPHGHAEAEQLVVLERLIQERITKAEDAAGTIIVVLDHNERLVPKAKPAGEVPGDADHRIR